MPPKAIASAVIVKLFAPAAIVEPVVKPALDKVVAVDMITAPVKLCVPEVVIVAVLIAVVPETDKLVMPETAPENVALPMTAYVLLPTKVELFTTLTAVMLVAPNAKVPPTAPVNVTVPAPAVIVNARADVALLSVPLKLMLLSVVAKVTSAPKVALPV